MGSGRRPSPTRCRCAEASADGGSTAILAIARELYVAHSAASFPDTKRRCCSCAANCSSCSPSFPASLDGHRRWGESTSERLRRQARPSLSPIKDSMLAPLAPVSYPPIGGLRMDARICGKAWARQWPALSVTFSRPTHCHARNLDVLRQPWLRATTHKGGIPDDLCGSCSATRHHPNGHRNCDDVRRPRNCALRRWVETRAVVYRRLSAHPL
jgi:hypothetical protein